MKVLGIRKLSKTRDHFLSQFTYPLELSHALSDLSGWETTTIIEGSFVKLHLSLDKRPPYATNYKRINVWFYGWLVFHILRVSRLRRDIFIVRTYFGLPGLWSFCKRKGRVKGSIKNKFQFSYDIGLVTWCTFANYQAIVVEVERVISEI